MGFNYQQPYIVVCACIAREGKILLVKENHYPDAGKWNFPGGKLDFGEDPVSGVSREAREETGLDYAPTALLGIHSIYRNDIEGGIHAFRIGFLGEAYGEISIPISSSPKELAEVADYRWFTPDEILNLPDKDMRYLDIKIIITAYKNNVRYPMDIINHHVQRAP